MRRKWYELKRLWRLLRPSAAERLFIETMGWWWRIRYRVRREYPVGQFWIDFALPQYRLGIEIDGSRYHLNTTRDYERDLLLARKYGWEIIRFPAKRLYREPQIIKQEVLKAIRGPK